ncbi:type II secretion system protein F [Bacteriovorax sp. BSW11_IV]|uniref:type II secretion system inner membrane protein GspF n=1 Tax=Bacteriovorax sp. BSW11_IV TaxID=1353529 RepID=UPI000389E67A|nr:type II secretion system inner membrane protein GspF [Bacteriovorax sp. BSW11_IV]EQC47760.1 type II secretion system protein F [Bacteriovorax sp. BSW11_IV]
MAIYAFKGLDKKGNEIKGSITSDSLSTAKQKARAQGIMLMEIKERKAENKKGASFSFGSGVSVDDLALMTRQLATLLKAKIQIVEALTALIDQTENEKLKLTLSEVRQKVNEGTSLARAMADYPKIFDHIYVNMVEAGESSGTLELVLLRLADFTESQVKLKTKVKGALMYPTIMMTIAFTLFMIIFIFVIPKITKMFAKKKMALPFLTEVCIAISNFLINYWYIVVASPFVLFLLFRKWISTASGKSKWDAIVLKIPTAGKIVAMINIARFTSTLATLLTSGVPILTSLNIVKNLISNVHMQKAVELSRINVAEGSNLAGPLVSSGHFPPMVTHMISLGEKSGELEPMLKIVAENYQEQVDSKLSGLTSILEPIMIIVMGLGVGIVVFAVIMPMMQLNSIK